MRNKKQVTTMGHLSNKLKSQSGFGLVELMVGLVIGLIATLMIMQVFSTFEGQKRSTTGSADAQTNGSIALFNIQREVQLAGFGLPIFDGDPANPGSNNNSALRCAPGSMVDTDNNGTADADIFPIAIADGGAGVSDSLTVRYGNTGNGGIATKVSNLTAPTLGVDNTLGCMNNDTALFVNGTNCASNRVNDNNLDTDTTHITLVSTAGMSGSGRLTCLGAFTQTVFAINADNELASNGLPIVSEVVDFQAQYGISNVANSNQVVQWVNATGVWAAPGNVSASCSATVANRNCIRAVRVAVVARNNLLEKSVVTNSCSALNTASPTGLCAWAGTATSPAPAISLAAAGGGNYRYRVYETIIPVRNLTFSGALL
jgi:type IV pilus assembly protein PilW